MVWLTTMESNILWLPTGSESSLDKLEMESQCFNDELVSSTVVWVFTVMLVLGLGFGLSLRTRLKSLALMMKFLVLAL